jgi:saccharopine dehydrogenase-like NADP-dependent oxidoreductase
MGQISLALARSPADSDVSQHLVKATQAAEQAGELTRLLLAYSGRGQFRRQPLSLYELILKDKRELVESILTEAKPPVDDDVVLVYAVVEGWKGNALAREEYYRSFHPIDINGRKWRAISWTTAASIAAVVEMVADQKLPQTGFLKQEEIDLNAFLETQNGQLFKG